MDQQITIGRDVSEVQEALARAANVGKDTREGARAARAAVRDKARSEVASGQYAGPDEPVVDVSPPAAPRENLDSVELELPNGLRVEFGPPVGVALSTKLLLFFGGRDPSAGEDRITATMMCLRSVNGQPVSILNSVDRDKWVNAIGDDGLAMLQYVYREYWPPPTIADLKIIKKNPRM